MSMRFLQNKKLWIVSLLALMLVPSTVFAGNALSKTVIVEANQTIDGNYFAAAEQILIDGNVNGDVIVAGGIVTITGSVTGDVIAAGGQVRIFGPVQGDIRLVGGDVHVDGIVGKNVTILSGNVLFARDSAIGASATVLAGNLEAMGRIEQELLAFVGALKLSGRVGGDVNVSIGEAQQFIIHPTARLGGDLNYKAPTPVQVLSGAEVSGEVRFSELTKRSGFNTKWFDSGFVTNLYLLFLVICLLSLWILGLIILWLAPKHVGHVSKELSKNFWSSFGKGLVITLVAPIVLVIIAFTVVGIPLVIATVAALFLLSLCGIIHFATFIGEWMIRKATGRRWKGVSQHRSMVLGVLVFVILAGIPFIGWLLKWIMVAAGLGATVSVTQDELKRYR